MDVMTSLAPQGNCTLEEDQQCGLDDLGELASLRGLVVQHPSSLNINSDVNSNSYSTLKWWKILLFRECFLILV